MPSFGTEGSRKSPSGARMPRTPIKRQRPSYSCTECTRRKLRCSKRIPCLACIERGIESQCRRRHRASDRRKEKSVSGSPPEDPAPQAQAGPSLTASGSCETESHTQYTGLVALSSLDYPSMGPEYPTEGEIQPKSSQKQHKILDTVSQDAAVILEFLAFNRQQILSAVQLDDPQQPKEDGDSFQAIDLVFTAEQVDNMISYHQDYIAWIHNVVHMPTFWKECKEVFEQSNRSSKEAWLPLYFAMLSVTLYHTHPSKLQEFGIYGGADLSLLCYQKSIDGLNAVEFMKNHNIYSVQAICLLIYIGHNSGQSDRVSILLASASRIAQCLGLHRLGSKIPPNTLQSENSDTRQRTSIQREVSKRAWWFLVRQDWLQIPYNNTYNIHPSQFDTEMPKNCYEDTSEMISSSDVIEQPKDCYTQGSYTTVLNKASIIIWNLQDRMCQRSSSKRKDDGENLKSLYKEVLQADHELKQLVDEMPRFFRPGERHGSDVPTYIVQQRSVLSISIAHKFYSIHRHFQILSLKDPWFAYTKVSCLPLMRRSLVDFLSLPDNPSTYTVSNIWTVNAQILTAAVWLLFELMFSKNENEHIFEAHQIRDLAMRSLQFLKENEHKNSIAKRGVGLIESLLDTDRAIKEGTREQFSLKEIISRVEVHDRHSGLSLPVDSSSDLCFPQMTDFLFGDNLAWEDMLNVFDM